jgi:hypothetical protein
MSMTKLKTAMNKTRYATKGSRLADCLREDRFQNVIPRLAKKAVEVAAGTSGCVGSAYAATALNEGVRTAPYVKNHPPYTPNMTIEKELPKMNSPMATKRAIMPPKK